jgi:hypothetical protein
MYKIKTNKNIKDLLTDLYRTGKREIRVNAWRELITVFKSINLLLNSGFSIQHQELRLNAAELLAEETSLPPPVKILTFIYFIVPKQLGNSKKKAG